MIFAPKKTYRFSIFDLCAVAGGGPGVGLLDELAERVEVEVDLPIDDVGRLEGRLPEAADDGGGAADVVRFDDDLGEGADEEVLGGALVLLVEGGTFFIF